MRSELRSLFVIGLPRSLTSLVYDHASRALGLAQPRWTSAGEILNGGRMVTTGTRGEPGAPQFTPPEMGFLFSRFCSLLDDLVAPEGEPLRGRAWKDVVQPLVVASGLAGRDLALLRIRRPLHEVAHAMWRHGWLAPAQLAPQLEEPWQALLAGLERAQKALDRLPAVDVEYEELIFDETPLHRALAQLYPKVDLAPIRYIDDAFRRKRDAVLASCEAMSPARQPPLVITAR